MNTQGGEHGNSRRHSWKRSYIGTGANDEIRGFAGIDLLEGRDGDDLIRGDDDDDTILGGDGADEMYGGGGIDTLSYAGAPSVVLITLGPTGNLLAANGGHALGDTGDGFENIIGTDFNDVLTGNDFANFFRAGNGNDDLFGGSGDDTLIFDPGFGHDRITDFVAGAGTDDVIRFNQNNFQNFNVVINASEQVGDDVVITLNASNSLRLDDVLLVNLHADDFDFI